MSDNLQAALNEIVYMVRFSSSLKGKKYFVYGPTAQRTRDKKELWEMIKNDKEIFARIVADTGLDESEIEERIFKLFPNVPSVDEGVDVEVSGDAGKSSLHTPSDPTTPHPTPPCPTLPHPTPTYPPYHTLPHPTPSYPTLPHHTLNHPTSPSPYLSTDEPKGSMESVVKKSKKFSSERDMNNRKVRVENFSGKEKVEDCEAFLKTFEKVVFVERIVNNKKSYGVYDVAFEDSNCANEFLKIKKLKYKKRERDYFIPVRTVLRAT